MKSKIRRIMAWLDRYLLLSILVCSRVEKKLSEQIENSRYRYQEECQEIGLFVQELGDDAIQRHQDSAARRLKLIEDKARANLLGITIGVAVLFSGFNLAAGGGSANLVTGSVRVLTLILFAFAVGYLLAGGLMALKALRMRPLFAPSVREEATASQHMRAVQVVWALDQNERTEQMRKNALSVSFNGIRNGVIVLALAVVLPTIAIVFSGSDSPTQGSVGAPTHATSEDSAGPTNSASSRAGAPTDSGASPPGLVDDTTASPEAVDTLP